MARSIGSYYREREKDKPYRTAEIALGFLGDLIAQNNQQSLDYQKLALQEQTTRATQEYREDQLASKTITTPTGQTMQYNPDTNKYDIQIAGQGAGVQDWGQAYGDQFFNKYLDGQVEYEDTDKNGVIGSKGDRPWVGPAAQLWRDYTTAKVNNEPDFELKHPETMIASMKAYDGDDPVKISEINAFLSELGNYQNKIDVYNQLRNTPVGTKATDVDRFYKQAVKQFEPKKLTQREVIGVQTQLNTRNRLIGYLTGAKEVTVFSGADASIFDETAPTEGMKESRRTLTEIQMTPEKRKQMEEQIKGIENFLDSMDIPYSKTPLGTDDPLGILD